MYVMLQTESVKIIDNETNPFYIAYGVRMESAVFCSDAILPMDGMNVGYNSFDFGNYLWGQSMQRLNIPLSICLLGANVDNLLNHWPQLDSNADQQAIRRGYMFKMIGK
jgi:hypothetical protein